MAIPASRVACHRSEEARVVRKLSWSYLYVLALGLSGACSLSAGAKVDDLDDAIEETVDEIPDPGDIDLNVKVCGDQTLGDLFEGDAISDECRDKVESFLPEAQSSFESRVVVLGQTKAESGERTLFVIGADASGNALFTTPPEAKVSVELNGELSVVANVGVELPLDGDLLSLSVVNDYSASMRDEDLEIVSEIETDLFSLMPPIYEGETTQFSDVVDVKQAFSEDETALLASVAIDSAYERGSTALHDGMGVALASLTTRARPLRVLLVSTDGAENASTMFTEDQLLTTIDGEKIVVIMLGALFADVKTLRTLSGDRGIFFYTRGYLRLKTAVQGLVDALTHVAAVHLPASTADATSATVEIAGQSVTVPLD
jgi:hypothetical protein